MSREHGIFAGLVIDADDPLSQNRARVVIPQYSGAAPTGWVVAAVAERPAVGDRVFVAFEGGDDNHPIYWRSSPPAWMALNPSTTGPGWVSGTTENGANGTPQCRVSADGTCLELSGQLIGATKPFTYLNTVQYQICDLPTTLPGIKDQDAIVYTYTEQVMTLASSATVPAGVAGGTTMLYQYANLTVVPSGLAVQFPWTVTGANDMQVNLGNVRLALF